MRRTDLGCTIDQLLLEASGRLRLARDTGAERGVYLTHPYLLESGSVPARTDVLPAAGSTESRDSGGIPLILLADTQGSSARSVMQKVRKVIDVLGPAAIVTWHAPEQDLSSVDDGAVLLVASDDLAAEDIIGLAARAGRAEESALTRRLTALQRSLTQALASTSPLADLTTRLARTCSAPVALVDSRGVPVHATGPIPLALLLDELNRTADDARTFQVEGWNGAAVRVSTSDLPSEKRGWLIAASRRDSFPDTHDVAAVHVAASIAETSTQLDRLAQRQELAVRSSLLEQVLALKATRQNPELSGKAAALGFSFDEEVRSFLIRLPHGLAKADRADLVERLNSSLRSILRLEDVPHLLTARDGGLVGIVQAPVASLRRWLRDVRVPGQVVGIGRNASDLGQAVDSYHDAQLALRALTRATSDAEIMVYEDFDFATRLFSDVGLETMVDRSASLLRPIENQPILLEGLRTYFEHNMNTISAAETLNVHHNSLRYRLSKVEEILGVSLRDPSAISSLYLALTAQAVSTGDDDALSRTARGGSERPRGATASASDGRTTVGAINQRRRSVPGAAVGPDR